MVDTKKRRWAGAFMSVMMMVSVIVSTSDAQETQLRPNVISPVLRELSW